MYQINEQFKEILTRFIKDEVSAEEVRQLYTFIQNEPDAYEVLMQQHDIRELAMQQSGTALASFPEASEHRIKAEILSHANATTTTSHSAKRFYISRKWYAVAASVIVLFGSGLYFLKYHYQQPAPVVADTVKDIPAPTTNKAMITLANGTQVLLDSVAKGQIVQVGNVKLMKLANGQIAYQASGAGVAGELQYNTLINPQGSKVIDMQLADGSHVWLNAGSSITYPVAFTSHERKVGLKGEGYFEVTKDPAKKFIVVANRSITEVLGTHFNVNGYANNEATKITLLEGSIRESAGADMVVLRPGQQAQIAYNATGQATSENIRVINHADIEKVMAWKNGLFNFNGEFLTEVMKQLERWYDIEVEYPQGIPQKKLIGKMTKDVTLNGLLIGLKELGVNGHLEGRKLIVTP